MQTKQQIQKLLASAGTSPNKHLGQNFLIDLNLMRLLVQSANITPDDIVLEVGCGTGSMTQLLAEHAGKVIAVEFDDILTKIAKSQLANKQNVDFLNIDILKTKHVISPLVTETIKKATEHFPGRTMLVANLPYNVASPVIMNLVTGKTTVDSTHVTVQKEVADRMAATPNSDNYGILSILLAATGDIKLERILKPDVFWPQPKVDSAMVTFTHNEQKVKQIHDIDLLIQVVNLFMQHRRKMLKPCTKFAEGKLKEIHNWSVIFQDCCIDPHNRPEILSPEDYISIANLCCEYLAKE